ncbi:MAG TPA: SRPBCC family protein [Actinomycetes bacterium]|jgi:carbon monoxide dehydrogenase subunit G|nr:SRPBCC family protein [Actinomycetes bacterium]
MELEHRFTVPVPVAEAWDVLLDVERIAPCMPGATVDSFDGETIAGKVKVKVGPIQVTYAGTARFSEKDEAGRRAVIEANAKEARGSGTAAATITAVLTDSGGGSTDVIVTTDLAITGKPAQFGRGVMAEVGNKLLGRFADCLADELTGGTPAPAAEPVAAAAPASSATGADEDARAAPAAGSGNENPAAAVADATTGTPAPVARPAPAPTPIGSRRPPEDDAIDLLDAAGGPIAKRVLPWAVGLVVLFVLWRLVRRANR